MSNEMPAIFVLHCKAGYPERRDFIEKQFQRHSISFEYVLDWDISDLNPEVIERHFVPGISPRLMSANLKHKRALEIILERGEERALVMEDDIFLFEEFEERIKKVVEESKALPPDHVIYLSNSCNKYTPRSRRRSGVHLYENDHSRAADCYLITLGACQKRLRWLESNKISTACDHLFNRMDAEAEVRIYWAEDPIAEQGSMSGRFLSSVQARHSLWVQRVRWALDKFYKMHILRNLR